MRKQPQQACVYCNFMGTARGLGTAWKVCKHEKFKDMFTDGRALDLDDESVPDWCPQEGSKSSEVIVQIPKVSPIKVLIPSKKPEKEEKIPLAFIVPEEVETTPEIIPSFVTDFRFVSPKWGDLVSMGKSDSEEA